MRASWIGSIRTKIFLGCISLTLVTMMVGVQSQRSHGQLSDIALGIYDNAFIPMSDLRSAQSIILGVSRNLAVGENNEAVFIDQLQSALDALDVAQERAMSPRGEDYARQLHTAVSDLQVRLKDRKTPPGRAQFRPVEQLFDMAVQTYAADGYRMRGSVEARVLRTKWQTYAAMLASIVTALIITLMLSRTIVPAIRHAVRIATAIASGRLSNTIERHRGGEPGALLDALATMQDSIADKIACIERLMDQQASSYAAEIALQNARFEAALDNMTLGLCMFDEANTLLVQNRRFSEMFLEAAGADVAGILAQLHADRPDPSKDQIVSSRSFNRLLDDGRTILVCEEAMAGGGRVVTYEDITERQRAETRLSHMARHDALTGLPNRILFREHVEHGIKAARIGGVLAVLCLDLDRFKAVNDTLGHPIGDALLQETAVRLLQVTAETDVVVRLGGDEFAVISYSSGRGHDARILAEHLISVLTRPFEIQGHKISIGASVGIAETQDGLETPDELLKNADLALYLAKASGRGCYRVFEREMDALLQAKRRLELDLRAAISDQQLEVFYQPLLSAREGTVVAFEALLRWHHPERGVVSPVEFIPLAEETGLISELGLWVLNQACDDAMDWPGDVKVAINLSPLQFRSPDLVSDVTHALRRSGLPSTRLELEITESLMLQDTAVTLTMLHDLRALGISISMDDFGTGYSSLNYLRCFPFDKIKIDRSFIANMSEGSDSLAIVTAIISLGQSLRMNVVAEGVETSEQVTLLRKAGCHQMQGYLFGRPQPAASARTLTGRLAVDHAA